MKKDDNHVPKFLYRFFHRSGMYCLGAISIATPLQGLDQHWGIQTGAGYDRMVDEAADSPVVKDENQYRVSTGLSYKF